MIVKYLAEMTPFFLYREDRDAEDSINYTSLQKMFLILVSSPRSPGTLTQQPGQVDTMGRERSLSVQQKK